MHRNHEESLRYISSQSNAMCPKSKEKVKDLLLKLSPLVKALIQGASSWSCGRIRNNTHFSCLLVLADYHVMRQVVYLASDSIFIWLASLLHDSSLQLVRIMTSYSCIISGLPLRLPWVVSDMSSSYPAEEGGLLPRKNDFIMLIPELDSVSRTPRAVLSIPTSRMTAAPPPNHHPD